MRKRGGTPGLEAGRSTAPAARREDDVVEGHQGHGTGHQLISEVKRKNRLSLHAYEKNAGAVAFYQAEGFHIENSMTEKETGEQEYRMVFHESDESKESCSK